MAGAAIAAASFATILFLTVVDILQSNPTPYIGIISYVVLPVPLLIGLLTIPVGVWRERRRIRSGMPASRTTFTLNLNDQSQRHALSVFAGGTIILFLFTAYGSYRAFEWTESVEFCGATCHEPMEPEYAAYQNSPHARVKCVDCHVGSGAGWYVRSKLSGAYQVYAVLADVYPRPIPTPIRNLRPAQETCEQCHWPSHFSGEKKYVNTYFKSDEQNTRWTIALLMKIGGGNSDRGPTGGIHWHMNIDNEVTYVAADSLRQVIPFVRTRNRETGATVDYVSSESQIPPDRLRSMATNRMDCIDCHNRPSHVYRPPVRVIDLSLAQGRISTALPNIRAASIQAFVQPYSTTAAAMDSIPILMAAYYAQNYAAATEGKQDLIGQASDELKSQYRKNIFPAMNAGWKAYPNNIGHMTDLGCFRCHDGTHTAADGRVISKDCNICHTILYQGTEAVPQSLDLKGLAFQHPEDIGDMWQTTNCKECHTGQ